MSGRVVVACVVLVATIASPGVLVNATLPPDDTTGTGFVRDGAEAAAADYFVATDPSVTGVACEPPTADESGVAMRCYGTNGAGQVVTATATINDYGDIEVAGSGPAATVPSTAPSALLATYSGQGSAARPVDPITAPTIVRVTHSGGGEYSVQPQHGGVAVGGPLVTTTGAADGRYLVGLGGTISAFTITADGPWTLELHAITTALPLAPGTAATGDSPDVVAFASAGPATVDYTGSGPIVVRAVTSAGPAVLVDEASAFSGAITLPAGPGQLLVEASGPWTIALPEPAPTTAAPTTAAPTTSAATTTAASTTSAASTSAP